jgi:hypothetical protein
MNILLTLILVVNVALLAGLIYAGLKIRAVWHDIVDFITPPGDNLPCPAAEILNSVSETMANHFMLKAKAALMGIASGNARGEAAVEGAVADDLLAASSPLAAGLLQSMPSLKKLVRKNPALLQFALSKFAGLGGSQPAQTVADAGHNGQKPFDFKIS